MRFIVEGEPVPKGRPKFATRGKFVHTYTPPKTRIATQEFQKQAKPYAPKEPLQGPLKIMINFFKKKPTSYKADALWTKKPDIDNLVKLVLDAMNKIFFKDDSQIVCLVSTKSFGEPRTEVQLEKWNINQN